MDQEQARADVEGLMPKGGETMERVIVGALRDAINAHGPITEQWIASAAKRIIGNLHNVRPANAEPWMLRAAHVVIHGHQPHSAWSGERPEHIPEEACEWAAMAIAEEAPSTAKSPLGVRG